MRFFMPKVFLLKDIEVHENLISLRKKENALVSEILEHLNVIEERRIYCDYGISSLFVYCVKVLNYSDGEAWRRVQASRLLKLKPEIKINLDEGKISLTSASDLMNLFNRAEVNNLEQNQLLSQITNKSSREAETIIENYKEEKGLKKKLNTSTRRRRVKATDLTKLEIYFGAEVRDNLDFLKGKLKIWDDKELIELLIAEKRKELDPKEKEIKAYNVKNISQPRSIAPSKVNTVYKKANSACGNCGSHFDLQIDHIIPVAANGDNELSNLQILCRECNLRKSDIWRSCG
jgi:5-methylcytosine-specific restriction endonuclease McrA